MGETYLRESIDKLIPFCREMVDWFDARNTILDRDARAWFLTFEIEYARRVVAEKESAKKKALLESAMAKLSGEERQAFEESVRGDKK